MGTIKRYWLICIAVFMSLWLCSAAQARPAQSPDWPVLTGEIWYNADEMPGDCALCGPIDPLGIINSTNAINEAIHYACVNGGNLFIPNGTYLIGAGNGGGPGINIESISCQPGRTFRIYGESMDGTILQHDAYLGSHLIRTCFDYGNDGVDGPIYVWDAGNACNSSVVNTRNNDGLEIAYITLQDNDPEAHHRAPDSKPPGCTDCGTDESHGLITKEAFPRVNFHHIFCDRIGDECIEVSTERDDSVINVSQIYSTGTPSVGSGGPIVVYTGGQVNISDSVLDNASAVGCFDREDAAFGHYGDADPAGPPWCIIGKGIEVAPTGNGSISNVTVTRNWIRATTFGVLVSSSGASDVVRNIAVTLNQIFMKHHDHKCSFALGTCAGISIDQVALGTIDGVNVSKNYVEGAFYSNGRATRGNGLGISRLVVEQNTFRPSTGVDWAAEDGILIRATTATVGPKNDVKEFGGTCLRLVEVEHPVADNELHVLVDDNDFGCLGYLGKPPGLYSFGTSPTFNADAGSFFTYSRNRVVPPEYETLASLNAVACGPANHMQERYILDGDHVGPVADRCLVGEATGTQVTKCACNGATTDWEETNNATPLVPATELLSPVFNVKTRITGNYLYADPALASASQQAILLRTMDDPLVQDNVIDFAGVCMFLNPGDGAQLIGNQCEGHNVAGLSQVKLNNTVGATVERNKLCGNAEGASSEALLESGTADKNNIISNRSLDTGCTGTGQNFEAGISAGGGCNDGTGTNSVCIGNTLNFYDFSAWREISGKGTVLGDHSDTWLEEGDTEVITEVSRRRRNRLIHAWEFDVSVSGVAATFSAIAWAPDGSDSFDFSYSTDGVNFVHMFEVSNPNPSSHSFALPPETIGALYVRVIDTNRRRSDESLDSLFVDLLRVRVDLVPGDPPLAPSGLTTTPVSSTEIQLAWQDNSDDESGFEIERSSDGVNYELIATASTDVTAYADQDLSPSTIYYYRVSAYNSSAASDAAEASATTFGGALIKFTATSYKRARRQIVDLTWSGVTTDDTWIYRDGSIIAAVAESSFTDRIRIRSGSGGSYLYQVCEEGGSVCSGLVEVGF